MDADTGQPAVPFAGVVGYVSAPPAETSPTVLRRLCHLNWAAGVLLLAEFPAIFFGAFLYLRYTEPRNGRLAPTITDMWRNVLQTLPDMAPVIGFTVACGLAAMATAWLIGRHRGRWFGAIAGSLMCLAFPFGTLAGLPTAIVLLRRQTRTTYQNDRRLESK